MILPILLDTGIRRLTTKQASPSGGRFTAHDFFHTYRDHQSITSVTVHITPFSGLL
jgi:hypothetical protein